MQPPSENASGTREELRSDVEQVTTTAANRLHSEMDSRKDDAASQAKSVSSAISRAAGELDEGAPAWLKSSFEQGAKQIQRFADVLEQKDSRQITEEVRSFARNSPGTFLAGCAAAGFAAARILKAGGEQPASGRNEQATFPQADTFGTSTGATSPASSPGEFV